MFDTGYVVAAFEGATGVRLEKERYPSLEAEPFFHLLPRLENFSSPEHANDRFGGHFTLRIYLDPDGAEDGFRDEGLERSLPERGPQEYQVSADAQRANVEVMFWGDASEITPKAQETWALLTSCLGRLSSAQ
jgi:hypothetical protein